MEGVEIHSEWVKEVQRMGDEGGCAEQVDAASQDVILWWGRGDILSLGLADFKRSVAAIAGEELAPVEVQFLREYPEALSEELFLRACEPLFEKGVEFVDWMGVEEKIAESMGQFYLMDLSQFDPKMIEPLMKDLYFHLAVKNREGKILAFAICAITPALPRGDVKVVNFVVRSEAKGRGLEKVLLSSIFEVIPQAERLFLSVRPTDREAIQMYDELGFAQDLTPVQDPNHKMNMAYLVPLEYRAKK